MSNMEEIYDKDAWEEILAEIEEMTVKEIRKLLPDGIGFFIFGDSHWAILKAEEIKQMLQEDI